MTQKLTKNHGKSVILLRAWLLSLAFLICGYAIAAEASLHAPPERSAYVSEGETLTNILRKQYPNETSQWPIIRLELIQANPDVFVDENADLMREGTQLRLVAYHREDHNPDDPNLVPVGIADEVVESVIAMDIGRGKRMLRAGGIVYRGDTISTGFNATARLTMKDNSQIHLRENSTLSIDQFAFSEETKEGNSVMRLVEGGFRAITGLIGKRDRDDYKVETPVATIGIRGTDYAVKLCGPGQCRDRGSNTVLPTGMYTSVVEGEITLKNDSGEYVVRRGEFVRIDSTTSAPKPEPRGSAIVLKPAELDEIDFTQPPEKEWGLLGGT